MRANELRIQNTINHKEKGLITIKGITEHCGDYKIDTDLGWVYLKNCKPIPLTEEWLIKFDITKNNGYPYKFLNGFIKIRNGVYFYKYYDLDIELEFVHQLQNLYFTLTGEELTIK